MSKYLDKNTVEGAFEAAARAAVSGTKEVRAGRFAMPESRHENTLPSAKGRHFRIGYDPRMPTQAIYQPKYADSRALVIGINKYQYASPLIHACNDAKAVAEALVSTLGFPQENVELLLDGDATRGAILGRFLRYADSEVVGSDDRIVIFFAGHGHTLSGRRGETGFLVPADGKVDDLASLIRWDELTRNADLIPAKHMIFLMDACYGGLALTRTSIPPGSMRFLKDMLQRYARQVLTAGKGDEVVSDGGGTRSGHSIFTSHLLDGIAGAAAPSGGIITGYGLMAYVYDKVSGDPHSHQTPHFGFLDGDGDVICDAKALATLKSEALSEPKAGVDIFIKAPVVSAPIAHEETVADVLKRMISTPNERIRLSDYVFALVRRATGELGQNKFPPTGPVTKEEFATRVQRYEEATSGVDISTILLARWADSEQIGLLEKTFEGIAEADRATGGTVVWLRLASYPLLLLMYEAGISSLAAGRYDSLRASLLTSVHLEGRRSGRHLSPIVIPVIDDITELHDAFKMLPEMERKYVPRSEHVFQKLQPVLEDQLFLGRNYERLFDEFEIFMALTYCDLSYDDLSRGGWGPPGRFAWKERGRSYDDQVFSDFVSRAKKLGDKWEPLKVGFFGGSAKRFADVADTYSQLLAKLNWW